MAMEQGELEASPFYSPEIDIEVYEHERDSNQESPRHEEHDEEELGPDIKPPQAKVKKEKHKHRHKHEKRKSGDRDKSRSDKTDKSKGSKHRGSGESRGENSATKERRNRPQKDQQFERDKRHRQQIIREEEKIRRERSIKERERLEQLEMERQRLDREIRRREQEQREKLRRDKERQDRNKAKGTLSADDDKRRAPTRQDLDRRREKDIRAQGRSRSPHTRRDDMQGQERKQRNYDRNADERSRSRPQSRQGPEEDHRNVVLKREQPLKSEPREQAEEASSEDSESDSEESSSGDSESGSDTSSEEEEEDMEQNHGRHPEKVKSRFDSASEPEEHSDPDSGHHSDHDYLDDTPPQSPIELLPDLPPYFPALQGCRNVDEFNCLNKIEEGTYGVVYRAKDKKTDEVVALKRLKMEKEKEGFPITSLREINTLLKAQHPNIVTVREIVVGSNMDRIYIVMDYVEHDLKALMETMKEPFIVGEVKTLMIQLLRGVAHLHDNWIIHRDLKTSNLLLSHSGILKIGDFGLAREYGSPLKHYTPIVVTLWYRAPELLLATKEYSCPIDLWSVGCIMAEFLTRKPLFPGKSEIDELNRIFKELGTPNEKIWPGVSELKGWKTCTFSDYPYNQLRNRFGQMLTDKGFEVLNRFLTYNPKRRITAEEALKHEWFKESPQPVDPSMFPTWPAKSEQTHRKSGGNSPKPPSGGKAYNSLMADEDEKLVLGGGGGFHLAGGSHAGGGFSLKF